ncbi:hypothetical protein C8F01DRAFT_1021979 [Mycena amicta]|nr:hypothetical protein C8F01DRAFT_1021979 [Mycena amicta]
MSSPTPSKDSAAHTSTRSELFDDPAADVILVSSDQVQFRLHRVVLSIVSPFFQTMFSLPQGENASETVQGLPTVQMNESGAVLQRLLRFWYPGVELPSTPFATISELAELLELIVLKYEMHSLIPASKMQLERLIVAEPLAGFAVAVRYGWKDIALKAAKESLRLDIRSSTYPLQTPAEQWRQAPGTAFYALVQYHQKCAQAVMSMTNRLLWTGSLTGCGICAMHGRTDPAQTAWFGTALSELTQHYERAPFLRRSDYTLYFAETFHRTYNGCSNCKNGNYVTTKTNIAENWWARIDAKIDAIELEI